MAQVPYSPVPNVVPSVPGLPRVGIETPPAAFGAATAAAVRGLGQQTEQSANEMFGTAMYVQQLRNETWAKDEFVKRSVDLGNLENEFYKLKGADAEAARPQYMKDVQNLYQTSIANAPNPQAARFLGDSLSRRISYSLVDAGRHAAQQDFIAQDKASDDVSASALSDIQNHPNNPDLVRDSLDKLRSEARKKTQLNVGSVSDFNQRAERMVSEGLTIQLKSIGFDQPQTALQMLDANQKLPDDSPYKMKGVGPQGQSYVEGIKEWLQKRNNIVGADAQAQTILKDLTPDSGPDYLEKKLKQASDEGKQYGAEYKEHLIAKVNSQYHTVVGAHRLEEQGVFSRLSTEITGADGGPPLTDRSELLNNPVRFQMYESLSQTATGRLMQDKLMGMIDHNSEKGSADPVTQQKLEDQIRGLAARATHDQAARDEFYKLPYDDIYKQLDRGRRGVISSELARVQRAWAKPDPMEESKRVFNWLSILKPSLESAGLRDDPNNQAVRNKYYEFAGRLSQMVKEEEARTGKKLSDDDVIKKIAPSALQAVGTGGIGGAVKSNGGIGAGTPPNLTPSGGYAIPGQS